MKVKPMKDGQGLLDGLKKVAKDLKQPAKVVGKEVVKELVPIAKDVAKEAIKQKMSGSSKEGKEGGFLVTGSILAGVLANELMKKKGNGIYTAGVKMTPQQTRNLRRGGAITLKKEMLDDAARFAIDMTEAQAKKVMDKLKKNKGVKITMEMLKDLVDKKTGGSIFGKVASVVAPIIAEKVIDAGAKALEKKIDGAGHVEGHGIYSSGVRMGDGIFTAGSGVGIPIQTGSPYLLQGSPASKPFIDSGLLTKSKKPTGKSKSGEGMCLM